MTENAATPWWRIPFGLVLCGFLAVGAFFLITEHTAHVFGVLFQTDDAITNSRHADSADKRWLRVTDGRYTADGKACCFADEIGVGTSNSLANCCCRLLFVSALVTRGDDEHGAAARRGAEDQRFGDLRHRAADRRGSVRRCARSSLEFQHGETLAEHGLDLEGGWGGRGFHRSDQTSEAVSSRVSGAFQEPNIHRHINGLGAPRRRRERHE